uniref:receptor protein-tyrosine kinase n=1 Tax=Poecilia mexicana TaxID=48701 RepID=A0A3B3XQJ9_9TELE
MSSSSDPVHQPPTDSQSLITSCDFESLCYWTFTYNNTHSDWSVVSPQQLKGTGARTTPEIDHSLGRSDGHFLLLSPSDAEKCEHQIISPVLPGSNKQCILQVALYESGPTLGNLTVLIKPLLSDLIVHSELYKAVIGQMDEPIQVTLLYTSSVGEGEATVALDSLDFIDCGSGDEALDLNRMCGKSFHCVNSDVCIDQSQVCNFHTDCPLGEDEGLICDALPFGSYCSFESDSCGWAGSSQHSGWRRVAGDELLQKQDMQGVTLQRTPGHFLYLQVRGSSSLKEASFHSSFFPPPISTSACQMRFSLYLYGLFNGSLQVAIEEKGTGYSPLIWETQGQSTDDWKAIALEVTDLSHGFHVHVKAAWGRNSNADLAFDNIAIGAACFKTGRLSLMTWWFNSCGASGPHGPTQAQCDSTYRNKNVSVTVGKEGPLKGVQMWKVPATNRYHISAYGAAGGKGAKNHNKRNHGVFISAIFPLEKGEILHILVGHQGEDACPGRNPLTQKICLGESSVIEDNRRSETGTERAGGGGGGGGATYIFKMEGGELVPLLIAAGGGGNAYLEDPESSLDQMPPEQFENSTTARGTNGQTGAAGGGGGWKDTLSLHQSAGRSLVEGAVGGTSCPLALSKLSWSTYGGFGGGGGACTAGGGGGGYRGGDAALTDDINADGQNGVSFIHPMGEIFLQPLAGETQTDILQYVYLSCASVVLLSVI